MRKFVRSNELWADDKRDETYYNAEVKFKVIFDSVNVVENVTYESTTGYSYRELMKIPKKYRHASNIL